MCLRSLGLDARRRLCKRDTARRNTPPAPDRPDRAGRATTASGYNSVEHRGSSRRAAVGARCDGVARRRGGDVAGVFSRGVIVNEVDPHNFDALYRSGMMAAQRREFAVALEWLRAAARVNPNVAALHFNLGSILAEMNQTDPARQSFETAIALNPRFSQAYFSRAVVLKKQGFPDAALASYDQAIAVRPDYADAYYNRGRILHEMNRLEAALASYDSAIALNPAHAGAHCNRGIVLGALGRWDSALVSYERALALDPRDAGALYNRGVTLRHLDRPEEALASYDEAIASRPNLAEAYCNRGIVLKDLNRFEAALASYDRALELAPELAEAHCGRGEILGALGRVAEAAQHQDQAIALRRDFPLAHFAKATALLLAGDYERGWAEYEHRRQLGGVVAGLNREFATPPWRGSESIAGATILLHAEQGLGDTLQFSRYATLVASRGARVVLDVPPSLKVLLTSIDGVAEVVAHGESLPSFGHHCSLMSLPLVFRTTLSTIPAPRRYLHSSDDRREFWRKRLPVGDGRMKIGLVWSGGFRPDLTDIRAVNRHRDIPVEKLASLRHRRAQFFSLQVFQAGGLDAAHSHAARREGTSWDDRTLLDYTSALGDFADTAALIDNLDLVISVDTAAAHLAGALGKPVWILNRFDTCWRWLLDRDDTPWYSTARLYRQSSPGDWDTVIERVRSDLFQRLDRWPVGG